MTTSHSTFVSNNTLCLTNSKIVYCLVWLFLFVLYLALFFVFFFSFLLFSTFFVWFVLDGFFSPPPLCPPCFRGRGRGWGGGVGVGRLFFQPRLNADLWLHFYLSLFSPFSCILPCLSFVVVVSLFAFWFVVFCFLFFCLFFLTFGGSFFSSFLFDFVWLLSFSFFFFFFFFFQWVFLLFFFFFFFFWGGGRWAGLVFILVFPPSVAWSFLPSFLRFSFCLFVCLLFISRFFSFLSFFYLWLYFVCGVPFFSLFFCS